MAWLVLSRSIVGIAAGGGGAPVACTLPPAVLSARLTLSRASAVCVCCACRRALCVGDGGGSQMEFTFLSAVYCEDVKRGYSGNLYFHLCGEGNSGTGACPEYSHFVVPLDLSVV